MRKNTTLFALLFALGGSVFSAEMGAQNDFSSSYRNGINSTDENGYTPLHLALRECTDNFEIVRLLHEKGGLLRPEEDEGKMPANPLADVSIANGVRAANLGQEYGAQHIYEEFGKRAIWSLAQALITKRPWAQDFNEALDFIAMNRRLVAFMQVEGRPTEGQLEMGVLREKVITTLMSAERQASHAYAAKIYDRYNQEEYGQSNCFFVWRGEYKTLPANRRLLDSMGCNNQHAQNVLHMAEMTSRWGKIKLCCLDIGNREKTGVLHTAPEEMNLGMGEMAFRFERILTDPNSRLDEIAALHWWLAQVTPHIRGGGAIAEWMAIALMLYKGYEFKGWAPNVETWSEAMLWGQHEFVKRYRGFLLVAPAQKPLLSEIFGMMQIGLVGAMSKFFEAFPSSKED